MHLSKPLVSSMALAFFKNTKIFKSIGVSEISTYSILNEVLNFTCPCILKIIDNHLASGGMPGAPDHFVSNINFVSPGVSILGMQHASLDIANMCWQQRKPLHLLFSVFTRSTIFWVTLQDTMENTSLCPGKRCI